MSILTEQYSRTETRSRPSRLARLLKRLRQTLTGPKNTPESVQWEWFGSKPINGIFWVTGQRPASGVTRDENGTLAFTVAGESQRYTALVSLRYHPEIGITDAFPIAPHETGDFDLSYGITHYAPFVTPKPPETEHLPF